LGTVSQKSAEKGQNPPFLGGFWGFFSAVFRGAPKSAKKCEKRALFWPFFGPFLALFWKKSRFWDFLEIFGPGAKKLEKTSSRLRCTERLLPRFFTPKVGDFWPFFGPFWPFLAKMGVFGPFWGLFWPFLGPKTGPFQEERL